MPASNGKNSPESLAELQKFLASPEGKQLFRLLSSDSAAFQKAAAAAKAGKYNAVKELLSPLLQSDEAAKLLSEVEKRKG